MNLILKRDHEIIKGNILRKGKIMFYLSARLELNDEENDMMVKYDLANDIAVILSGFEGGNKRKGKVTIDALLVGLHYESEDATRLCEIEQEIRNLCERFKADIEIRKKFSGEEIIEY